MNARPLRGFTILELMVVVVVMAVLLALAVPTLRSVTRKSYVSSAVNGIIGDLQYARAEAANRHQFVSICRSSTGSSCDTSGVNYDVGYIVYAYNAAAKGANQAYNASTPSMSLLRTSVAQDKVSAQATDGNVITFGQTGLLLPNGSRILMAMVICARLAGSNSESGVNGKDVPGARIRLAGSGTVVQTKLVVGEGCVGT